MSSVTGSFKFHFSLDAQKKMSIDRYLFIHTKKSFHIQCRKHQRFQKSQSKTQNQNKPEHSKTQRTPEGKQQEMSHTVRCPEPLPGHEARADFENASMKAMRRHVSTE